MIYIKKDKTPVFLRQYQADRATDFKSLPKEAKDKLRKSLMDEQSGLCAYCMSKLGSNPSSDVKIEHIHPQSRHPEQDLSYSNLLAVCPGNPVPFSSGSFYSGSSSQSLTCDSCKGDKELFLSPLKPEIEKLIAYDNSGNISAAKNLDPQTKEMVDHDLNTVLNLNHRWLVNNRKKALQTYKAEINQKFGKGKEIKPEFWRRQEKFYSNGGGRNTPYVGILLWFIRRYINQSSR